MTPENIGFLAGMITAGVASAYSGLETLRSRKIVNYNNDPLIEKAVFFIENNSIEELIETNKPGLPKKFIEELRAKPIIIDKNAYDFEGRWKTELYEIAKRVIEKTWPTGPMSYLIKRIELWKVDKKIRKSRLKI